MTMVTLPFADFYLGMNGVGAFDAVNELLYTRPSAEALQLRFPNRCALM